MMNNFKQLIENCKEILRTLKALFVSLVVRGIKELINGFETPNWKGAVLRVMLSFLFFLLINSCVNWIIYATAEGAKIIFTLISNYKHIVSLLIYIVVGATYWKKLLGVFAYIVNGKRG